MSEVQDDLQAQFRETGLAVLPATQDHVGHYGKAERWQLMRAARALGLRISTKMYWLEGQKCLAGFVEGLA